jgi:uncharacterized surface protein with fasciclin (FAS1) repeats
LTEFDGADGLRWQTVNDGVMGGLSQGGYEVTSAGTLLFSGETSLENNGGFSSIRTRPQALNLADHDGLALRVRGDGRSYKVSLRTEGTGRWIAYWAELPTVAGQWTEVRIPFSEWVPTSFGRRLPGPRLRVKAINSVGFMLYDKQAGPFSLEVASISAYTGALQAESKTILEVATDAGSFQTLLAAAKAAGLLEALSGPGPLTVLAPTDEAFAALAPGTVEWLLQPWNRSALERLLKHHVVAGRISSSAALEAGSALTMAGTRLEFSQANGTLSVNGAEIAATDVTASNGVVHVLRRVLEVPAQEQAPESVPATSAETTASGAVRLIERAIERGVPLFNDGQALACQSVYEVAAMALLDLRQPGFPARIEAALRRAVSSSESGASPRESAWALRRALDAAYRFLLES